MTTTIRFRKRIKNGPHSYNTYTKKGFSSRSTKLGNTTITTFADGSTRRTTSYGNGTSVVQNDRKRHGFGRAPRTPKMARGSPADSGVGLLVLAICLVGALAAYAALLAIYLVPVLLAIAYLYYLGVSAPEVFEIPDHKNYEEPEKVQRLLALQSRLFALSNKRDEIYRANVHEIPLTVASEHTRFDAKYGRSANLNMQLEQVESAIAIGDAEIKDLVEEVLNRMPEWEAEFSTWATARAARYSLPIGLLIYGGTVALTFLYQSWLPKLLPYSSGQVLLAASCLSVGITAILWMTKRHELMNSVPEEAYKDWDEFRDRWSFTGQA